MLSKINTIKGKLSKLYSTGALHITAGTFATKFVAFFGSIVVIKLMSKEEYGLMGYVENIYSYAFLLASLGLSFAILRYLVITDDPVEKKQYFSYILKRSISINIIIAVFLCLFSLVFMFPENYARAKYLVPVVALLLPFQDLLNEDLYTVRAFFKNKFYAYAAFVSSAVLIVGRIVGAFVAGVDGVLWSRVLFNALFAVIGLFYISKKFFIKEKVPQLPRAKRSIVNTYSIQYMITNGFWALFMLNDIFLIGTLLNDPAILADYKVAYVFPGNISIFAAAIGIFVAPYFTKNEKNKPWIRKNFKKVFILSTVVVGTVALIIGVFGSFFISLISDEQYLNTLGLMRVLLVAAFLNSGVRFTIANLLAAMGEIRYNMIVSVSGILIQVVLDIVLIPNYGVMAVAISNCFVFGAMAIILFFVFYFKFYKNDMPKRTQDI